MSVAVDKVIDKPLKTNKPDKLKLINASQNWPVAGATAGSQGGQKGGYISGPNIIILFLFAIYGFS